MTRTPAQALTDALREADREVIALGGLGWHSKPDGSPEREMFRRKLEAAGRISQQIREMGMEPPPVGSGFWSGTLYDETTRLRLQRPPQQQLKPPPAYCTASTRDGLPCKHYAAKDSAYCRFHSGQQVTSKVTIGEREVQLAEEQARIVTQAVDQILRELRPRLLPGWRRRLIWLIAR